MRYANLTVIILIFFQIKGNAQLHDSTLVKKLSINGFCLCQTTLSSLKQSYSDLKEVEVEEMDFPKGCFGQDSRFIAGKGYYTLSQPGMIFQKEQDSSYISKIRLTKQFRGNLPDGNSVDLSKFLLKDLLKLYPQFKDKWQSRDCSDYWKFSNDTISFYVKIDKTKSPQFPIDEAFYMDKPIDAIDLLISCRGVRMYDEGYHTMEVNDPVFFIDSVQVPNSDLSKLNPNDIAEITIIKDTATLKKFGLDAKRRLIYMETKTFVRRRYWKYFGSKSSKYAKIISGLDDDSSLQYVLNDKVLKKNFESDLGNINDNNFIAIKIISKEQLIKDYNISDKDYGIIISSK